MPKAQRTQIIWSVTGVISLIKDLSSYTFHRIVHRHKNSTSEKMQFRHQTQKYWNLIRQIQTHKTENQARTSIQKETFDIKGRDRKCSCATMLIKVIEGNDTYNLDLEDNVSISWRLTFSPSKYLFHDVDLFWLFMADVMELKALVWEVTGMRPRTQYLEFLVS